MRRCRPSSWCETTSGFSVSRFLRELDIPILEREKQCDGRLVRPGTCSKVLGLFGKAYGKAAGQLKKTWSDDQNEFVRQAVTGLSQDRKVISVRNSSPGRHDEVSRLDNSPHSARSAGSKAWVSPSSKKCSDRGTQPIQPRQHQEAIRGLLSSLLPVIGTISRGQCRVPTPLQKAAGYERKPRDFQELMGILDKNLRLITPVDDGQSTDIDNTDRVEHAGPSQSYHPLMTTWVPSLREC